MQKTIEAVYSGGVFRPVEPLDWPRENLRVMVTVSTVGTTAQSGRPLDGWRGGLSDEDARGMLAAVESEFERVDPR